MESPPPPKCSLSNKKRTLEVNPSSDNEEPFICVWPRYLVIQGTNKDIPLAKLNHFAIGKGLKDFAGTTISVRRLRSHYWGIQTESLWLFSALTNGGKCANKSSPTSKYELQIRNHTMEGQWRRGAPPCSSGSVLDHTSLPPVFESRRGHIWRLFRLSLRLITFGSRSAI